MKNKFHAYCDIQCPHCKKDIQNPIRSVLAGCGEKEYECPFCKTKVKINPRYHARKTILFTLVLAALAVPVFIFSDWLYALIGGDVSRYSPGRSSCFVLLLAGINFLIEIPIHAALGRKLPWAAQSSPAQESDEPKQA